jgi:hypothetical protein
LDECFPVGFVDSLDLGKLRRRGRLVAESGGVRGVGGGERFGPGGADLGGGAVVDRRRGVEPDAGMAVDMVVVIEELGAERPCIRDRAEAAGEGRAVLRVLNWASE